MSVNIQYMDPMGRGEIIHLSSIYVITKYHQQDIPTKNEINYNPYISRSPSCKLQNSIDVDVCCWNPLKDGKSRLGQATHICFMYLGKFI